MAQGIVGREDEVGRVHAFLDDQVLEPSALLIEGEPGIGKTTLFDELLRVANERGYTVLVCRPAHSEMDLSYLGLTEMVEGVDDEVLRALPPPQAKALNVILRREEPGGPIDRLTLGMAVLGAVRAMAANGPMLIAIDDLQWLDRPTSRVFSHVLRRFDGTSIRIALVRRTERSQGWPFELERAMPETRLIGVRLGPVGPTDLARLLRRKLGWAPAWPRVLRIAELSGGNPFYALEIARARGSVQSEDELEGLLPGSLNDLVRSRLAKLPVRVREVVELASVPRAPTVDLLRRMAPAALDLREALSVAGRAGVITVHEDRIKFAHPTLAGAAYGSLPKARKVELHRALALLSDDIEERARHLAIATDRPDAEVATVLESAAERAWRRGAPDASAELLRMACRLTPVDDGDALAMRRISLGRILWHAGDAPGGVAELESLVASLLPGPIRARALYHLMYVGRAGGVGRAIGYGLQAAAEATDDPSFQSEIYDALSRNADVDPALKLETARKAVEAIGRVRDPDPEVAFYARAALVEAEFFAGLGIRLELLEDVPAAAKPRFPPVRTARLANDLIGRLLGEAGRLDEGREVLRGLYDRAMVENRSILPTVLGWMSRIELYAGRFAAALALLDEAMERVEETGNVGILDWLLGYRAVALVALGRLDEAESAATRAIGSAGMDAEKIREADQFPALNGLALSAMARGRFDEATGFLRLSDQSARSVGFREPRWTLHSAELVEALIGANELGEAGEVLVRFEEDATRSRGEWSLATSARSRALLLAAHGRLDDALEAADRSLRALGGLPFRFERARCLFVKGQVHRRRREKRLAREALADALGEFEAMGTPLWAERARAELARVPVRMAPAELTPTEEKVAGLAAAGLTNREIAERAFMSPKTVEVNLTRIYRKLGVPSRAALAARFATGAFDQR